MKSMSGLTILISILAVGSPLHADDPQPDNSESEEWVVLEIRDADSLILDGVALARKDLPREAARLAERVRRKAKDRRRENDPESGLPAAIDLRADNDTPYSVIASVSRECQQHGFQRWAFSLKWPDPDAPPSRPSHPTGTASKGNNDLSAVIRTIPIHLHSDDRGKIDRVTLGEKELKDFRDLRIELSRIQDDPDSPFDWALLKIDSTLAYSEMVRVAHLLARYRITRFSFMEIEQKDQ